MTSASHPAIASCRRPSSSITPHRQRAVPFPCRLVISGLPGKRRGLLRFAGLEVSRQSNVGRPVRRSLSSCCRVPHRQSAILVPRVLDSHRRAFLPQQHPVRIQGCLADSMPKLAHLVIGIFAGSHPVEHQNALLLLQPYQGAAPIRLRIFTKFGH